MKRMIYMCKSIVCLLVSALLYACNDDIVEPIPSPVVEGDTSSLTEEIRFTFKLDGVPIYNSVSTYGDSEEATGYENSVKSVKIFITDAANNEITTARYLDDISVTLTNDSIYSAVIKVSSNTIANAKKIWVHANGAKSASFTDATTPISTDILPSATHYLEMSGETDVDLVANSNVEVHLKRTVAKLRVRVSKHPNMYPSDLKVDYGRISINYINIADRVPIFGPKPTDNKNCGRNYVNYTPRDNVDLRRIPGFDTTSVDMKLHQIDSCYVNENFMDDREDYFDNSKGRQSYLQITIPTRLPTPKDSLGNIGAPYPWKYDTYNVVLAYDQDFRLSRNTIYTIDVLIAGQEAFPQVVMQIASWEEQIIEADVKTHFLNVSDENIYVRINPFASTIDDITDENFSLLYESSDPVSLRFLYNSQPAMGGYYVDQYGNSQYRDTVYWFDAEYEQGQTSGKIKILNNLNKILNYQYSTTRSIGYEFFPRYLKYNSIYRNSFCRTIPNSASAIVLQAGSLIKVVRLRPFFRNASSLAYSIGNDDWSDIHSSTMTWSIAMGQLSAANSSLVGDAPATEDTGCNAYWEDSPTDSLSGKGKWRLTTSKEMYRFMCNYGGLPYIATLTIQNNSLSDGNNGYLLWTSTEINSDSVLLVNNYSHYYNENYRYSYTYKQLIQGAPKSTLGVYKALCIRKEWDEDI